MNVGRTWKVAEHSTHLILFNSSRETSTCTTTRAHKTQARVKSTAWKQTLHEVTPNKYWHGNNVAWKQCGMETMWHGNNRHFVHSSHLDHLEQFQTLHLNALAFRVSFSSPYSPSATLPLDCFHDAVTHWTFPVGQPSQAREPTVYLN